MHDRHSHGWLYTGAIIRGHVAVALKARPGRPAMAGMSHPAALYFLAAPRYGEHTRAHSPARLATREARS